MPRPHLLYTTEPHLKGADTIAHCGSIVRDAVERASADTDSGASIALPGNTCPKCLKMPRPTGKRYEYLIQPAQEEMDARRLGQ